MDRAKMYEILFAKLNQEGDGVWSRFNVMLAVNLALFAGFGAVRLADGFDDSARIFHPILYGLCAGGFGISLWSFFILGRFWRYHEHWRSKLIQIELLFDDPSIPKPLTEAEALTPHSVSRSKGLIYCCAYTQPILAGFGVAWILLAIWV